MRLFKNKKNDDFVLNAGGFLKSLDLSGSKKSNNPLYTLHLEILRGVDNLNQSQKKVSNYVIDLFQKSFDLSSKKKCQIQINRLNEKRAVGNIEFTISELIKRWMELQDETLISTFKETMNYSDYQIEQINNSLTSKELKFAENILFNFYENYLKGKITGLSLDEITKQTFFLYYTNELPFNKYSYVQLVDNHNWREEIYKYPVEENDAEFDDDDNSEENIEEDEITIKLDETWGNSIWEVGNRNWGFYDFELKNKTLKYAILDTDIFESLNKYVFELEVFKNLSLPKKKFLSVLDNQRILNIIQDYHGEEKRERMVKLINSVYNYKSNKEQDNQNIFQIL